MKAIKTSPEDADNWVVWGLILRTVGNYKSAEHKFEQCLRIDPNNETAKFELDVLRKIMMIDKDIDLE